MKKTFAHQVYFWLKNPQSEQDKARMIAGIKALTAIKTIKSYHLGWPVASPREVVDDSFTISWLTIFEDQAGMEAYQVDPLHLKFVEEHKHLWGKLIVYDSTEV